MCLTAMGGSARILRFRSWPVSGASSWPEPVVGPFGVCFPGIPVRSCTWARPRVRVRWRRPPRTLFRNRLTWSHVDLCRSKGFLIL